MSEDHSVHSKSDSLSKVKGMLAGLWQRVAHKEVLYVLLVFILGFIVRAQLMRYELFFEFDSYWHARMVSYILQGLGAPSVDPLGYYHNIAAATLTNTPILFWYISAAFYKIFTLNAGYDVELWILWVKILPALYGALISVGMFFLGKELFKGSHEKAAGLFAGIIAAVMPAFVYRTMGGFFEDDSFGFLGMVLGFVFFVRAVREPAWKKENILNAIFAGLGFALMAFTWSAFNMLVPIILGVGFVQFLLWVRENELEKARAYGLLWIIAFVILGVAATLQNGTGWLSQFGGILGNLFLGSSELISWFHVLVFIVGFIVLGFVLLKLVRENKISQSWIPSIFALVLLVLVISPLIVTMFNVSLRTGDVLGQTVGEESDGKNYFGNKYSFLVLFAIVGIPAIGWLLLKRPQHYESLVLPLIWLLVTFFMAWGKLKFTYYWGLPLALMGGVVLALAWKWVSHRSVKRQKLVVAGMAFMLVLSVGVGTLFVTQNVPNIELSPGWKTALFWANENLPQDAAFFNWWDEGHWISFLSNRKVIIDNRNADPKASADVAQFVITRDVNVANDIVQKYGSTHLIFGDDLLEKLPNLGFYAYNVTNINDPRIQGVFGVIMNCSRQETVLTKEVSYACGGNTFSEEQMAAMPTQWTSTPNQVQDSTVFFLYRDFDNRRVYAFTRPANESMLVRLWFGDESVKPFYTEVYRNTGGVRIYEVNASALAQNAS